jgi:hypothetical protein
VGAHGLTGYTQEVLVSDLHQCLEFSQATDQEIAALLTMHDLVAEADDSGQVRQDLLPLQRRLQRMLGESRSELKALLGRAQGAARKCGAPQGQDSSGCGFVRLPSEQGVAVSSD